MPRARTAYGHPPGWRRSHFVRQFRVFDEKRAKRGHVGKLFPINNKERRCPHFLGGPWRGVEPLRGETPDDEIRRPPNLREPFCCPRWVLVKYARMGGRETLIFGDYFNLATHVSNTMVYVCEGEIAHACPLGLQAPLCCVLVVEGLFSRCLVGEGCLWYSSHGERWSLLVSGDYQGGCLLFTVQPTAAGLAWVRRCNRPELGLGGCFEAECTWQRTD